MKTIWYLTYTALAVFVSFALPHPISAAMDADALRLYGGTYLSDCGNPFSPKVIVAHNSLRVVRGNRQMVGRNLQAAYSYFDQSPPANYQVALLSEIKGMALLAIVYRDRSGLYLTLDGDPKVRDGLGKELMTRKYHLCNSAKASPEPAPAVTAPPTSETMKNPWDMLADPRFKSVYFRELGPLKREPWLTTLEGPAPPVRMVAAAGEAYELISSCKPHDCADHNVVMLYSAVKKALYGKVHQSGKTTLIGMPPPAIARELDRLWQTEWRSGQ